jgi:hypothetical protein
MILGKQKGVLVFVHDHHQGIGYICEIHLQATLLPQLSEYAGHQLSVSPNTLILTFKSALAGGC